MSLNDNIEQETINKNLNDNKFNEIEINNLPTIRKRKRVHIEEESNSSNEEDLSERVYRTYSNQKEIKRYENPEYVKKRLDQLENKLDREVKRLEQSIKECVTDTMSICILQGVLIIIVLVYYLYFLYTSLSNSLI
jgi:tetrahydromethanopterin S-methyltransferase subunit G